MMSDFVSYQLFTVPPLYQSISTPHPPVNDLCSAGHHHILVNIPPPRFVEIVPNWK